ncbi:hypothetical protein Poli38472_011252 [Pythium oligandrum]|uniref:EF-hand domain-containing protein n=1 Tax=Pythium oligandrum TaxID=41045 RepID=A0A8K1CRY3_PYTOL|nr:hypothetical protein Poli38472_011252 [Pythium oligandrum]|eukprot:TMW67632.1 hypothetical protein Poli38472_011252 [Pythium oligandrum]
MRLFRRAFTNERVRRRGVRAYPPMALSLKKRSPRNDAVSSIVNNFHALSVHQRYRAVARVLQHQRTFNDDIEQFFREADKDNDGLLNHQEFRSFLTSRFSLKIPRAHPENNSNARPSNYQLKLLMLSSAIPFIGFGFVDNIIMLAAGDMIEDHFHETYHITMLCAAALGNTVSDVAGLSLGGIIESFVRRIGIPDPHLSKAQARMAITHWCNFFASAGGITLGCILGMFPLLFMNHEKYEQEIIAAEEKRLQTLRLKAQEEDGEEEEGGTSMGRSLVLLVNSPASSTVVSS